MRVLRQRAVEALEVLVQHRVTADRLGERAQLRFGRQLAVDEQVRDLDEARALRQILDLYGSDDQGTAQAQRTLEVAQKRLAEMTAERDALEASMAALRDHVRFVEKRVAETRQQNAA